MTYESKEIPTGSLFCRYFLYESVVEMKNSINIKAKWIQGVSIDYGIDDELYYQDHPQTLLKSSLTIETLNQAVLHIGCLGYYIVYINGNRVGNDELNNDWTNYTQCVYYETYNITEYLKIGFNEILIELGNGMYNPAPLKLFGKYNLRKNLKEIGQPQVICDIWVDNICVLVSDEKWKYGLGNTLFNNLYLGEKVDYTRLDNHVYPVFAKENKRNLQASFIPKIKRCQSVSPQVMKSFESGIFVDFKEMISGFITIDVQAKKCQKVILQYSENFEDNRFDFSTVLAGSVGEQMEETRISGGKGCPEYAIQTDTIICEEGLNHFQNKFSYHSFRYIYIQGCTIKDIKNIKAFFVHTDLQLVGQIKTDHSFFNHLYDVALRTKLNNVHGTFEDCARERLGYGGDMVALATSNLYIFDLESFYKKMILDFRFDQTNSGGIPETAPYIGIQSSGTSQGEGPLLWQLVYPYLLYKRYQYYGDSSLIEQEYPYIEKQMNYLLSIDLDRLASCCLGDHGSVLIAGNFRKPTPDKLLLGYCSVMLLLKYNILLGKVLGKDMRLYRRKYEKVKRITVSKFKNEDGSFGEGTQSSYAFAIMLELDNPKKLCRQFVDRIIANTYVFNSGIFGHSFTYEALNQYGYNDIIEKWLLQDSTISYKTMLSNDSKALSELFIGKHFSLNHAMFASYQQWYYQGLAGIQIKEDAVGFDKIKLSPYFSKEVNSVECCLKTRQGTILSSWVRNNKHIQWKLSIPKHIEYEIDIDQVYQKVIQDKQIIIDVE